MLTQLKSIGFADKEAKVYLAMLELGPSPMLEIAAKAGVNRPTAYMQIESLKKMGLVSTQTKGKKQSAILTDTLIALRRFLYLRRRAVFDIVDGAHQTLCF